MISASYFAAVWTASIVGILTSGNSVSDLKSAIRSQKITCQVSTTGKFNGNSVLLEMSNKSSGNLTIVVTPGTLFYPKDSGEQTLIVVEDQIVELSPGEKKKHVINAYCSELHDRCPSGGVGASIGKSSDPKFDSLFVFMKGKKFDNSIFQNVVWAISDGNDISAISADSKDKKELRKFLSALTGQEEVDYTSDYILTLDSLGYIRRTLHQVKGELEISSTKSRFLYQYVYDENGKMKYKSQLAFQVPEGKSDYRFNIIVKNWSKGNYSMKLKDGKDEIATYEFKV